MRLHLAVTIAAVISVSGGEWPQWRGPERDGHAATDESLTSESLNNPAKLWHISIGGGFSSPVVNKGRVFYADERGGKEVLHCLDAETGREIWSTPYASTFQDEWGAGPRSTPFTDDSKIFMQSCDGRFICAGVSDGKIAWSANFEDYGVKFLGSKANEGTASRRGNNGCGILDGNSVIIPAGGTNNATIVCLDKDTGKVQWRTGNEEAAYSSLQVANIAGVRQVIGLMADSLMGLDRISGKILWQTPLKTGAKRHAATPVIMGNRIVVNSHTFGTICFEIAREGGGFEVKQVWRNKDAKINLATPVLVGGYLYSHGASKNFLCLDASNGVAKWSQPGFGAQLSSALAVGDNIFVLTDAGEAVLIKAKPDNYEELARTQVGGKNWNHPALAEGKLFVRDGRELAAFRVK